MFIGAYQLRIFAGKDSSLYKQWRPNPSLKRVIDLRYAKSKVRGKRMWHMQKP